MTRRLLIVLLPLALFLRAGKPGDKPEKALRPGLYAVFDTSEGIIRAELFEKYTPVAVANFVGLAQGTKPWRDPKTGQLVRRPLYNGVTFHRVIREEMIQAGDPTGTSAHNCGITVRDEFLPGLRFDTPGRLAVANTGKPDSGACQFFFTDEPISQWNNQYTIFGQAVEGLDVIHAINRKPLIGDRPEHPVIIRSVTIQRILKK